MVGLHAALDHNPAAFIKLFLCGLCGLCVSSLSLAADDCKALNGTYQYQSVAPREGVPEYLSNFAQG